MEQYFSPNYAGPPFELFGWQHLSVISLIILACLVVGLRRHSFNETTRRYWRWGLALLIAGSEASWHIWKLATGEWNINVMLPLWLCSLVAWLSPLMLLSKNYRVFEFTYFMGLIGPPQAILTPDLMNFGFPHFRFIQFFLVHGSIIVAVVYMTAVEGMRPTWASVGRVLVTVNLYWGLVALINPLVGGNYLYTAGKLPTPSLLDYLGPWPWYLLSMEGLGIILVLLLYLPFAVYDRKHARMP